MDTAGGALTGSAYGLSSGHGMSPDYLPLQRWLTPSERKRAPRSVTLSRVPQTVMPEPVVLTAHSDSLTGSMLPPRQASEVTAGGAAPPVSLPWLHARHQVALSALPSGLMGRLLVHRSGRLSLRLKGPDTTDSRLANGGASVGSSPDMAPAVTVQVRYACYRFRAQQCNEQTDLLKLPLPAHRWSLLR